jgi:hypothetical protein
MASPIHSIEKKSDICEATNDWIGYPFVINRVVDGIPAWAEKSEARFVDIFCQTSPIADLRNWWKINS